VNAVQSPGQETVGLRKVTIGFSLADLSYINAPGEVAAWDRRHYDGFLG
jgi:hypothetical protein